MRLAPRLVLAFGFVAAVSTFGLGAFEREQLRRDRTARFDEEVRGACTRVRDELARQAESDRKLIALACQSGELVDRTLLAIEADDLDARRLSLAQLVPKEREAFDLDELLLASDTGDLLGVDPRELLATPRAAVERAVRGPVDSFEVRAVSPALVARCRKQGPRGRSVALVGARRLEPLFARLGRTTDVSIRSGALATGAAGAATPSSTSSSPGLATASCALTDKAGASLPLVVTKSTQQLEADLAHIDEAILLAAIASMGVALILAVLFARNLGRPLAELAAEARKVASGDARPFRVKGSGEVGELVFAFDKMIDDLAVTRRRLAAISRVAAWREVARRVAHEVKNPLAPIRAAVETLRRLRARNDPAFDEYFDEATRTVLDEVHRISTIVTEFTRFARLPSPRPEDVDLLALAKQVVQLQRANAGDVRIDLVFKKSPKVVRADRDQIVQVLTNLVQNALDALGARRGSTDPDSPATGKAGEVVITLDVDPYGSAVVTVGDDGPGIAPEIASRLFEPYATTKSAGTGLGLAISQRIAMEHNGELAYVGPAHAAGAHGTAAGGVGALFRLVLPEEGPPPASEMTPPPSD